MRMRCKSEGLSHCLSRDSSFMVNENFDLLVCGESAAEKCPLHRLQPRATPLVYVADPQQKGWMAEKLWATRIPT